MNSSKTKPIRKRRKRNFGKNDPIQKGFNVADRTECPRAEVRACSGF